MAVADNAPPEPDRADRHAIRQGQVQWYRKILCRRLSLDRAAESGPRFLNRFAQKAGCPVSPRSAARQIRLAYLPALDKRSERSNGQAPRSCQLEKTRARFPSFRTFRRLLISSMLFRLI